MSTTAAPEPQIRDGAGTTRLVAFGVAALIGAMFLAAFRDVMAGLVSQWESNDAFSHGWLIAPMSAYIAWSRRDRLARAGVKPAILGGTLGMLVAVLALQVGRVIGVLGIQQLAMLLAIASLVVLLLGWRALRALWFPIGYLLFMMPVWDVATERLHFPFQLLSAKLGTGFLRLFAVPVYLENNFIYLPNITLEVARVCSGVNYLIAILALAVPLAYLTLRSRARQVALLLFGIAAGFFFNALRVAAIGFFSYHQLSEYTHGPWHIFQGLSAALVGYVAIFAFWGLLHRREGLQAHGAPPPVTPVIAPRTGVLIAAGVVALAALGWAVRPLVPSTTLSGAAGSTSVPTELGNFRLTADPAVLPAGFPPAAPADLVRTYRSPDGRRVLVLVSPMVPAVTPGARPSYWSDTLEADAEIASTVPDGLRMSVIRPRHTKGGTVAFWYQVGERETLRRHVAKLWAAGTTLLGHRPPWVVAVISDQTEDARAMEDFRVVLPPLREALGSL
jgi:exosortase